jgi:acetyl esterase/lipase
MKTMKATYLPGLILAMLTIVSCKDKGNAEVELQATSRLDVAYGADPQQRMDYYLPAGRSSANTKVMVLIHGGAWAGGDKSDFTAYVDTLKRRLPDYAFFNINYRIATTSGNAFPTQENDVKAALDFIYNKRSELNISDQFVLLGASAGGHLALLQAYKYASSIKIKAVVNFFGPSNMVDMFTNPPSQVNPLLIATLVGGTPSSNADAYFQSSPINFVTAQSPPTITFQGGLDPLVRPSQQVALHAKLQTNGVVNEYVLYPNEYHGWFGANLTRSFDKLEAFLEANVK